MEKARIEGILIDNDGYSSVILVRDLDDDTPRCPMYLGEKIGLDPEIGDTLGILEVSNPGCSHCWTADRQPSCPMFLKADMYGEYQKETEHYAGGITVYVTCMALELSSETIKKAFMDVFPNES